MTLTTLPSAAPVLRPAPPRRLAQRFADVVVLTGRNLVHIAREPLQLSDVTIQPVLFTLLFVYVFGSGVVLPGGGSYTDFAIAGLLALNLTTSAMGTAVGLSNDLSSGVIDRFRTLPMWRAAVLVGRSLADLSTAALCALIVALTGLVIGWRPDASIPAVIAGFALFLLFGYALSWGCACLGIVSKGPESAQGVGLVILFPLAIVSNALVPTQRHARRTEVHRRLEPGQRGHRRRPQAVGQPQSLRDHPGLAHAAPGGRLAAVVRRAPADLRPARHPPLPPPHHRLTGRHHGHFFRAIPAPGSAVVHAVNRSRNMIATCGGASGSADRWKACTMSW